MILGGIQHSYLKTVVIFLVFGAEDEPLSLDWVLITYYLLSRHIKIDQQGHLSITKSKKKSLDISCPAPQERSKSVIASFTGEQVKVLGPLVISRF